jgi:hypothetical protein
LGPNGVVQRRTGERGAVLSGLYDSRRQPGGIGFPSCSRELARLAPNDKDPHDYYAEIGVPRDASETEIRRAVRRLLYDLHPDTGSGDTAKFQRVHNIGKVLLDPQTRIRYNRTPAGMRLMDAVYAQELIDAGVAVSEENFEAVFNPTPAASTVLPQYRGRYDFFAMDHRGGDSMLANMWYHHLVTASGECGYRRVIKVLLTDSLHPSWNPRVAIMGIPRSWEPTWALAVVLFRRAGFGEIRDAVAQGV